MTLPIISLHRGHNATVAVYHNDDIVEVIELERFIGKKNASFDSFEPIHTKEFILDEVYKYLRSKYGFVKYQKFIYSEYKDDMPDKYKNQIPANEYIHDHSSHHSAHACNSLYQSNFDEALIVSFDGGGPDGYFNIYIGKKGHELNKVGQHHIDLGSHYHVVGSVCKDIKNYHVLTAAGKVLGLQSYGKVIEEWKPAFYEFFMSPVPYWNNLDAKLQTLSEKVGVPFSKIHQLEGQQSFDFARTAQEVFEEITLKCIEEYVNQYKLPIIITGGCALNIVLNTRIKEFFKREVFVAPNSSDCGLSVGLLLKHIKPKNVIDVTYKGIDVLDRNNLMEYVEVRYGNPANLDTIVNDLANNRILGVVQGKSEHGPRSLGNRSIICSPILKDMKDILNAKVKHREWFRPFAPIVRLEDVSEYFEWEGESRWMNFCPKVREQYKDKLPSITHVDGTARVQTITREQNLFIYDLITKFKEKTGVGVLVNTSFNVDRKPILSSYRDAFKVFDETQLDRLYLDGYYFTK